MRRRRCSLTKVEGVETGAVRRARGRMRSGAEGSGAAGGVERGEGGGAVLLLFELFDLEFGVLETGLAGFEQGVALFEFGEEFGQRDVAGFHRFDDGFEAGEGLFKGRRLLGFGVHSRPTLRAGKGFSTKL